MHPKKTLRLEVEEYLYRAKWDKKDLLGSTYIYVRGKQTLNINYNHEFCIFSCNSVTAIQFDGKTFKNYIQSFIKYI